MASVPNAIVSRSYDGTIRFWTGKGELRPGGSRKAHKGFVNGLLVLPEALVSWGDDKRMRFWSHQGEHQSIVAHDDYIASVMGVEQHSALLCRSGDCILFWTHDGERLGQLVQKGLAEVRCEADGLLCWTNNGAVRIWPFDSQQWTELGVLGKGIGGIQRLSNSLVTWYRDGAIRFWTMEGKPLSGGHPQAHKGYIKGLVVLPERLVSWGEDRAIRFWSHTGEPQSGGASPAHDREIRDVFLIAEAIVSVGRNGEVRQWDFLGSPKGAAWIAPGELEVAAVLDGKLWVYLLGRPRQLVLSAVPIASRHATNLPQQRTN